MPQKKGTAIHFSDMLTLLRGRIPGQVVIQYTDRCNAKCPQCGMRVSQSYPRSKMNPDNAKRVIDAAVQKGIRALSFTGGEPLLYFDEVISLIKYAGQAGIPYLRTGTNGFVFMNSHRPDFAGRIHKLAEALAATPIRNFWISIDSADAAVHEEMRGLPGVIQGIEKALPIFHQYGIYPSANLGINRNTGGSDGYFEHTENITDPEMYYRQAQKAFRKFYGFVSDLGFTIVNACYPMSLNPESESSLKAAYGATSSDWVVRFSREEKVLLFKALLDVIPEFRSRIRIFTPRASLYALIRQYKGNRDYGLPCRGGIDFFYVDHKECTYPCGYRGHENLGKLWDVNIKAINSRGFCRECDWECFRDPSELLGQFIEMFHRPFGFVRRAITEREYFKMWMEDLAYYKACDYFDGRKPPRCR